MLHGDYEYWLTRDTSDRSMWSYKTCLVVCLAFSLMMFATLWSV